MAIQVTCAKCFTRFSVSEKFAGQKGPCPKCKAEITIPSANEQVVVHETDVGPKDKGGRPILKPIFRQEAPITAVHWTIVGSAIFVMLVVAVVARNMFSYADFPLWALAIGSILCSFPMALVGYILLRNPESAFYSGRELWVRVAACAAGFAILWIMSPLSSFAFSESLMNPSMLSQSIAILFILLAGAGVSLLAFDFDYLFGVAHSVGYIVLCGVMRVLANLPFVPGLGQGTKLKSEPIQFGLLEPGCEFFHAFAQMVPFSSALL